MEEIYLGRMETLSEMESHYSKGDVDYFVRALKHPDRVIRIRALSVLEVLGNSSTVSPIGEVLEREGDEIVRHEAAFVLGQLGYSTALPYLEKAALHDTSTIVRHEAAVAMGVIGSEEAEETLKQVFNLDASPSVRFSAEIALSNLEFLKLNRSESRLDFARRTGG